MASSKPKVSSEIKPSSSQTVISIIVTALGSDRVSEDTLVYLLGGKSSNGQSFKGIRYPASQLEIIIVDGSESENGPVEAKKWGKKYKFVRYLRIPGCKTPGQALNAAIKISKGQYLLFTNINCVPERDWVSKMMEPFRRDPEIGVVGGEIQTSPVDSANKVSRYCEQVGFFSVGDRVHRKKGGYYPSVKSKLPRMVNGSPTCPYFSTANMAVSRETFRLVGSRFWEKITAEDIDFSMRVSKEEKKLFFQPEAVVNYRIRSNLNQFCKINAELGRGHSLSIQTHARRFWKFVASILGEYPSLFLFPFKL